MEKLIIGLFGGMMAGGFVGYYLRSLYGKKQLASAEMTARRIMSEAEAKADVKKKEGMLEAKDMVEKERRNFENSTRNRKDELSKLENRLRQKEENLDRKLDILEKKDKTIENRTRDITNRERDLHLTEQEINKRKEEQKRVLERISGISRDEAKKLLLETVRTELANEQAEIIKRNEQETRDNSLKKSKEIIAVAIQKIAADFTVEMTVSTVTIPNDDLKGRIIGREGRNIRTFEQATGVDIIVDDTPEAITISGFDGVRREIARIALERLITDGRIHPARIEEVVAKVKKEMDGRLREIGDQAAHDANVNGLHPEILKLLGKLKFRSSYGQNQLQHTLEVVWIASTIAGELGLDAKFCRKAGILHDIGKAIDHDVEGTHHQLSADIAKKYGESPKMINAILSHHEGLAEPSSPEAFIVAAADAISAARPGVRRENVEHYVKRLEKLEEVALSFRGVNSAYAISAGREVRILVEPEDINDQEAVILAKNVARKIEGDVEYPGQVRVTVIRETRAQDIAK